MIGIEKMTQITAQEEGQNTLIQLSLEYLKDINKQNTLNAVKCFEAIANQDFLRLYEPGVSSVYTDLGWFCIVDKQYKQAEIYLNKAMEFGTYLVPIKLGHIKYFQNNLKEAIDLYIQSSQKLGFIDEVIIEIQDDLSYLKVSDQNIQNLTDYLTQVSQNKTTDINKLVKEPDKSTPDLFTEHGYWKYSQQDSVLLFSSAEIKISFNENQKLIDDYDKIKKLYTDRKEAIEGLVDKIMIYQNQKLLQKIIAKAKLVGQKWVWKNWSLSNVVDEQDFEKRFGHENSFANIMVDANEDEIKVEFI